MNGRSGQLVRAAVFLSACLLTHAGHAAEDGYVLALSWQPGFCASAAGADKAECAGNDSAPLTLHGLWPNADRNGDGRLDSGDDYCLGADRTRLMATDRRDWSKLPPVSLSADLRERLAEVMPGVQSQLERHQWVKHGSCSGLGPERYFKIAVDLTEEVASSGFARAIQAKAGSEVARNDLLRAFANAFDGGSSALQLICRRDDGTGHLAEIRVRLRSDEIEDGLATALDEDARVKGNCPARFRIDP